VRRYLEIKAVGDAAATDPAEEVQRNAGRKDVVHRMEDGHKEKRCRDLAGWRWLEGFLSS